jgi:hypothetical protein
MEFKFLDQLLPNHIIELEILIKDTNLYTTLLFQCKGKFHPGPAKFGHQANCADAFTKFIRLAKSQRASLAITPEYSCPWDTIGLIINTEDLWPEEHKLWALGCESITPAEILQLKAEYNREDIIIYFDEEALNAGGGVLLDPLCYVFKTRDNNNNLKLVVLIQFKTQHMGVWHDDVEQEKYIPGKEVYVLRNDANSISLFTIICSEVENFNITKEFKLQLENRWDENPFIILNIQMNPKPSHEIFKNFRTEIMKYQNKDIISLNWAKGSDYSNNRPILTYSKSGILYKSEHMDYETDQRFIENHSRGLYYTYKSHSLHTYYLNSNECVFLIANHKPSAGGVHPALFRRTGPEGRKNYIWNITNSEFDEIATISDEFIGLLDSLHCTNVTLRNLDISVMDKERLINISSGNIQTIKWDIRWHTIDKLYTFFLDDNETIRRLTFSHDEAGDPDRRQYIEVIDTINHHILSQPALFPVNLSAFINNCTEVMFFYNGTYNYKFNLVTNDQKHKATVAYVGRTDVGSAAKTLKKMQNLFEKNDHSRKLVVVWYKIDANTISSLCDPLKPKVADDTTFESNSILK